MSQIEEFHNPVEIFCNEWSIYKKVIANNYMYHTEINAVLTELLQQRYAKRPISVIEFGCGDASCSAKALSTAHVERYLGYDWSEAALLEARKNLAALNGEKRLICGDLLEGVANTSNRYDLILTFYALHHLQTDGKFKFFQHCKRILKDGCGLFFVDVMRNVQQTRDVYINAYISYMTDHWLALSDLETASLGRHIRENDYPEISSWYYDIARQVGFSNALKLGHHTWHQFFRR